MERVEAPLIQYAVEEAAAAGITDMIFITGRYKRAIEDHFDKSPELEADLTAKGKYELLDLVHSVTPRGVNFIFIRQPEPLGLGHAVLCARPVVGDEPFGVILADDLIYAQQPALGQLIGARSEMGGGSVLAVQNVAPKETNKYGIVGVDDELKQTSCVRTMVEKPAPEAAPSTLAVIGRYVDGAMFVVRSDYAPADAVRGAVKKLQDAGVRVLATVCNGIVTNVTASGCWAAC